jgi:hypothetical protein
MKYSIIFFLLSVFLLVSCGHTPEEKAAIEKCRMDEVNLETSIRKNLKNTFDAPFPKRNCNLSRILGDTLEIEGRCCPVQFKIVSTRKKNLIIDITSRDTIFQGTVSRFRDLYYCSEQLNDTSFRIFALKITDSLIYGIQNYFQYAQMDSAIEKGGYPKLIKVIDGNKKQIRLHPNKKELRVLYTHLLNHTQPFEIRRRKTIDVQDMAEPVEPDDFELFYRVYPNPTIDVITIELQQQCKLLFQMTDLRGRVVLDGQLTEIENKIDISKQPAGIYAITIINLASGQTETIKIVKSR